VLAVMIVSLIAIARLWKKHGPMASGALPPEAVEFLGRKMIDQRNMIHLVRVGSKIVVLGTSSQGVSTLTEITDPVEVDMLAGLCQKRPGETKSQSFRTLFNKQPRGNPETQWSASIIAGQRTPVRPERSGQAHSSSANPIRGAHE
jgi:flagellar biogenesis protein FliO